MSAFLVSAQTINHIVASISLIAKESATQGVGQLPRAFAQAGFDTNQAGWEEQLAKAMFALNARAVAQRYHEPEATGFTYRRVAWLSNRYQLLKSINCWLYQCTEGDVPKQSLYQLFTNGVVRWLLESIVYKSPQYEAAAWD